MMGIIHDTCRKLAEAGNSIEVILEAVRTMEDGAAPPRGKKAKDGSPRAELCTILDEVHAQAVLDHRQRIRKPLTAHAAKLMAAEFTKCRDPNAAADLMILKGWQGFSADWVQREETRYIPQRAPSAQDQRREALRQRIENGSGSERGGAPEPAGYLPHR